MSRGDAIRRLLSDGAAWRLLALLLERPRPGWSGEVRALAAEIGDAELASVAAHAPSAREEDYIGILGPGGPISPREAAWRPQADPGRLLADLSAFYGAFAYSPRAEDPPDHIAVEAGFISYLRLKQAYALELGDATAEETTEAAVERFVHEHLGEFAALLAERLRGQAPAWIERSAALVARRAARARPPAGGA